MVQDSPLEDLPLEEWPLDALWQLFPIVLSDYDPRWPAWYEEEAIALQELWGEGLVRITHIGSTSVPGLIAKPTIDILLELDESVTPQTVIDRQRAADWLLMRGEPNEPLDLVFNKGYTRQGFAERVVHLHVRPPGDWPEARFAAALRENPTIAAEYASLKRHLADQYRHHRDHYTEAKGSFIKRHTPPSVEL